MAAGLTSAGGLECLAASISYAISYIYMDRFLAHQGLSAIVLSACQLAVARLTPVEVIDDRSAVQSSWEGCSLRA